MFNIASCSENKLKDRLAIYFTTFIYVMYFMKQQSNIYRIIYRQLKVNNMFTNFRKM